MIDLDSLSLSLSGPTNRLKFLNRSAVPVLMRIFRSPRHVALATINRESGCCGRAGLFRRVPNLRFGVCPYLEDKAGARDNEESVFDEYTKTFAVRAILLPRV